MKIVASRIIIVLFIISMNIGCDQVSKSIARDELAYYERIELLGDFFILTKVENQGAFLSMGDSLPSFARSAILIFLPALALIFALAYITLKPDLNNWVITGLSFIIGGGIANLYDRILYGTVTDFMNMGIGELRTGVFNFADLSIMSGAFIVMVSIISDRKKQRKSIIVQ